MGISLNPQQQAAINAYRKKHKIASIITDDAVVAMIKKEGGNAASIFNDNKWAAKQYKSTYNNSTSQNKKTNNQTKQVNSRTGKNTQNKELKDLELINTNGAGAKIKSKTGKEYTIVGNASNGRKIVKDTKGQYQILAHDGTLLYKEVIKKRDCKICNSGCSHDSCKYCFILSSADVHRLIQKRSECHSDIAGDPVCIFCK